MRGLGASAEVSYKDVQQQLVVVGEVLVHHGVQARVSRSHSRHEVNRRHGHRHSMKVHAVFGRALSAHLRAAKRHAIGT
jgi:hypothetical protein